MAHEPGHGRSGALTKSFKSSVKKQKAKIASGKAYASRSKEYHVQQAKRAVTKNLGLTGVSYGAAGQKFATDTFASKLKGKDQKFYGHEANKAINEYLVGAGLAKRTGGGGYWLSSAGYETKYGAGSYVPGARQQSFGAMGSGDPTGALTSTPISKSMLQSQNKFLGLATMVLSAAAPGIAGTAMRVAGAKNLYDAATPQKAYNQYEAKFAAKQTGRPFTQTRNVFGLLGFDQQGKKTKKDTLGGE
tara:strand:+ start:879 stop:1616 length:738 start_codon:yes stop_codon:yes gene_type:complete